MPSNQPSNDRTLAIITHVLGYFTSFIGPLIVLLASKSEWVRKHARRSLNWQLSLVVYSLALLILFVVSGPLMPFVIGVLTIALAFIGLVAISVADIVFVIIASIRASEGEVYAYPFTIRFTRDPKNASSASVKPTAAAPAKTAPAKPKPKAKSSSKTKKPSASKTSKKRSSKTKK